MSQYYCVFVLSTVMTNMLNEQTKVLKSVELQGIHPVCNWWSFVVELTADLGDGKKGVGFEISSKVTLPVSLFPHIYLQII